MRDKANFLILMEQILQSLTLLEQNRDSKQIIVTLKSIFLQYLKISHNIEFNLLEQHLKISIMKIQSNIIVNLNQKK